MKAKGYPKSRLANFRLPASRHYCPSSSKKIKISLKSYYHVVILGMNGVTIASVRDF